MTDRTTQPPERARAIEMLSEVVARRGYPEHNLSYENSRVTVGWAIEAMLAFRSEGVREAVEAASGIAEMHDHQGVIAAAIRKHFATLSPEEGTEQ